MNIGKNHQCDQHRWSPALRDAGALYCHAGQFAVTGLMQATAQELAADGMTRRNNL